MSILVVGTVAFDTIETPFGRAEGVLGGSATYIALAARYLIEPVRICAVVGLDFPQHHNEIFHERGIDLAGLERDESDLTFAWEGRYDFDLNQRETIATHLNVLEKFEPELPNEYRSSRIVCLGNLHPGIQSRVLDQVEGPDLVVCDTMNFWIENTPDQLLEVLKRIDVLIINDSEARELAQDPNLVRAARSIRSLGPDIVIIKKGEHGALLFMDDTVFSAPAFPLEDIYDPTGAGDTFAGGFVGCLAAYGDLTAETLKKGMIYGSAMASFCVEAFGVERLLNLTQEEISERMYAFHSLSAIPEFAVTLQPGPRV